MNQMDAAVAWLARPDNWERYLKDEERAEVSHLRVLFEKRGARFYPDGSAVFPSDVDFAPDSADFGLLSRLWGYQRLAERRILSEAEAIDADSKARDSAALTTGTDAPHAVRPE